MSKSEFDLTAFLPYLLNRAGEVVSQSFQSEYKGRYGMLRTEWRVLAHLGQYGAMSANDICQRADIHKTKVSRAVVALEQKRFLTRTRLERDRRFERLELTAKGRAVFDELAQAAHAFDQHLLTGLSEQEAATLRKCLKHLSTRFRAHQR